VGFAVRVENRYKGLRSPHKLKGGVSGCIRECAEARGKDFGLIAVEKGYNLYVCGNGGAKPCHAELLISNVSEDEAIKYLDRFLMYYVSTADRLQRTARWLEKLEGGLPFLRDVVVNDRLGICAELETQMQLLVDTYQCEWKEVVANPQRQLEFSQFVNTSENQENIERFSERGQPPRPVDWPKPGVLPAPPADAQVQIDEAPKQWVAVGAVSCFQLNSGAAIKHGAVQLAVFNFTSRSSWFATQNMSPHMNSFVMSRGILGDAKGTPKIACPISKVTWSLKDGACLSADLPSLITFEVKVEEEQVMVLVPDSSLLDTLLATHRFIVKEEDSGCSSRAPGCACAGDEKGLDW